MVSRRGSRLRHQRGHTLNQGGIAIDAARLHQILDFSGQPRQSSRSSRCRYRSAQAICQSISRFGQFPFCFWCHAFATWALVTHARVFCGCLVLSRQEGLGCLSESRCGRETPAQGRANAHNWRRGSLGRRQQPRQVQRMCSSAYGFTCETDRPRRKCEARSIRPEPF
jgi:hypothetical protein